MQGCPLRCKFCHNPETWNINGKADEYTPNQLIEKILNYKSYFKDNGGVTFSGGEPLTQKKFLLECLKLCKKEGIHTCIDTAGTILGCEEILKYTDLVLFDIKGTNKENYKDMTGFNIYNSLEFLNLCQKMDKKLWIRAVIVPGINDTDKYMNELKMVIKPLKNVEKVELLPYHTLGVHKYKELNIKYPLEGIKDMDKDKCKELENKLKKELF
jgi:pyruvate formate lyase activating enzyme